MACPRQESSSILGWLMNAAAVKCMRDFDLRINESCVWVNEVIAEAKKTLAVEDIKLLPKTPSAKSRTRRCQRPLRSNAVDNDEEDGVADPVSKQTGRKAGKRGLKFDENLSAGERSQLEDVEEDEEVKEIVGRCKNISEEKVDDRSTSAVLIAKHITETANNGKVAAISTVTEQKPDSRDIISVASAILDGTYGPMSPKFNMSSNGVLTSTRRLLRGVKPAMVAQSSQESASCLQNSIRKSTSVEKRPPKKALRDRTATKPQNTTKRKSLRSKARLSTTRRHSRRIGTRASTRTVAKKNVISKEVDCDDVEMKNIEIQVDLSDEEAAEGKGQTAESKTLTKCDVKETSLPPSSVTRSKSRKIMQLQEVLCGDPSFALKSVQAPSSDKPRNDQCKSIKRQQESGNDADDATNKRHRKDAGLLSPEATESHNSDQNSRSVAKAGTYVSSCYPVLKKASTPNSQNSSLFLLRNTGTKQDAANDAGFKNVMIKVKRIEEINQKRNEELHKKADERKRLREEQHISVQKRRQELEQMAVKKAVAPKVPEGSVLTTSTLERSKLSVLREQKLEIEQKRKAEEAKRLEKEKQIREERKHIEERRRQQLEEEEKRLKEEQERLKMLELQKLKEQEAQRKRLQQEEEESRRQQQLIAEKKWLEEEGKLKAERERVQVLALQKLKEQEAQKLKIQEQKLKEQQELQKLKEKREQMEREQRAIENKQLEEKKRQALLVNKQEMAGGQKQNDDQVLKEQNNSSKQNFASTMSNAAAPVNGVVHNHPMAGSEKGSNLNKTFDLGENCKSSKHKNCESYEMTPCVKKPKVGSSDSNYNIDDINSDDSTDDETRPRKKIPYWAQGKDLKIALINQFTNLPDVDAMFGTIYNPDLNLIFANKIRTRFNKRTSSANWDEPLMPRRN